MVNVQATGLRYRRVLLVILMMLLSSCVVSDRASPASVINLLEASDAIRATGYAVINLQPSDLPEQRRLLAIRASRLDAYRSLAEQVYGQFIDSSSTVNDLVLSNDSFRARVQGVIYGAELESITPVGADTYEVTLSLRRSVVNDLRRLYLQYSRELRA
jgi:outer membrane protein FlgP